MSGINIGPLKSKMPVEDSKSYVSYLEDTCKALTLGFKLPTITKIAPRDFTDEATLAFRIIDNKVDKLLDRSFEIKLNEKNELFIVTILGAIKLADLPKQTSLSEIITPNLKEFGLTSIGNGKNYIAKADVYGNTLPEKAQFINTDSLATVAKNLRSAIFTDQDAVLGATGPLREIIKIFESEKFIVQEEVSPKPEEVIVKNEPVTPKEEIKIEAPLPVQEEVKTEILLPAQEELKKPVVIEYSGPSDAKTSDNIVITKTPEASVVIQSSEPSFYDILSPYLTLENALITTAALGAGYVGFRCLSVPVAANAMVTHNPHGNSPIAMIANTALHIANSSPRNHVAFFDDDNNGDFGSPYNPTDLREQMHPPRTPATKLNSPALIRTVMETARKLEQSKKHKDQAIEDGVDFFIARIAPLNGDVNQWLEGNQGTLKTTLMSYLKGNVNSRVHLYDFLYDQFTQDITLNFKDFKSTILNRVIKKPEKRAENLNLDKILDNNDPITYTELLQDIQKIGENDRTLPTLYKQYILYIAMMIAIPVTKAQEIEFLHNNSTAEFDYWDDEDDQVNQTITKKDDQVNQTITKENYPSLKTTSLELNSVEPSKMDMLLSLSGNLASYASASSLAQGLLTHPSVAPFAVALDPFTLNALYYDLTTIYSKNINNFVEMIGDLQIDLTDESII